jgi:hypothetical protein
MLLGYVVALMECRPKTYPYDSGGHALGYDGKGHSGE